MNIPEFILNSVNEGVFVSHHAKFWRGGINTSDIMKMFPKMDESRHIGQIGAGKGIVTPYTGNLISIEPRWRDLRHLLVKTSRGNFLPKETISIFDDEVRGFRKEVEDILEDVAEHYDEILIILRGKAEKWAKVIWEANGNDGDIPHTFYDQIFNEIKERYGDVSTIRKRFKIEAHYYPSRFCNSVDYGVFLATDRDSQIYKDVFMGLLEKRNGLRSACEVFCDQNIEKGYGGELKNMAQMIKFHIKSLFYQDDFLKSQMEDMYMKIIVSDVGKFERWERSAKVAKSISEYLQSQAWERNNGVF